MTTVEAVDIKTSHSAGTKQPKVGKNNKIKQQNKRKELKWERKERTIPLKTTQRVTIFKCPGFNGSFSFYAFQDTKWKLLCLGLP